ncbi:uncharacterized protein LOC128724557 [Anopheles nili]|uniref:uncharacterized protein LOC128724557 n=1 Tax=Anopheles nili TaxID=185578 RepID=UPI00237C228F|nr:uncharacterized protein LOC128724557 [Anopheles nili]
MSSARCLNWSRPPPGRHPALRKQLSCVEPPVSVVPSPVPHPTTGTGRLHSVTSGQPGGDTDFRHFLVTGAIIHTNRLQTYHTYNQAHRGASASLLRSRPSSLAGDPAAGGQQQQQQRRRPSSASAGGLSVGEDRASPARSNRRPILCQQLSLDRSILVASTIASGMATVASGGTLPLTMGGERDEVGDGWAFNRKQHRPGTGPRNDSEPGTRKGLKPGKDSRINIKIFLGQTVQHDSSDTGISDTEGASPATTAAVAALQQTSQQRSSLPFPKPEPSTMSVSTDFTPGKSKPTVGTVNPNTTPNAGQSNSNTPAPGNGSSGRTSSLAQRRAQFQANRQNSEAHDRRHPPLVRAMSAPIRPADTDASKFLQGKKKPRRRKVLREKDDYNICEEDEYSDDEGCKMAPTGLVGVAANLTGSTAGRQMPACIMPMRSRSVLGGPCDIETLVSLLSSGGSDSEKEQESASQTTPATGSQSPTTAGTAALRAAQFSSVQFAKGRAPMLKKAGKSVSFQESDLKPAATAGLNRDYRKPAFQPTVASRLRRTQQLVSTLNAFQLKDKGHSDEKDTNEEKNEQPAQEDNERLDGSSLSPEVPAIVSSSSSKAETNKPAGLTSASTNGDVQTPKEQECYRLFLKMSKKGLAVSYDTILRGMLTPTELRVLQKKKNHQRAENAAEDGTDCDRSMENAGSENGTPVEELQLNRGSSVRDGALQLTIPEEPSVIPNDDEHQSVHKENVF